MENIYDIIKEMKGWAKKDQKDCPDITEDYIDGWRNAFYMLERQLRKEEKVDKKYFKILNKIAEEKIDITKLYILSCCAMNTEELDWAVMEYTYKCWLKADTDLDLAKLTAIVNDNWEEITEDKIDMEEIIDMCLN